MSKYVGWEAPVLGYAIVAAIGIAGGRGMNRALPGRSARVVEGWPGLPALAGLTLIVRALGRTSPWPAAGGAAQRALAF